MTLTIAFNYGGRAEIIDAVKQMLEDGVAMDRITERKTGTLPVRANDARRGPFDQGPPVSIDFQLLAMADGVQRTAVY